MSSQTAGRRVMPLDLASGLPFALALRIGIAAVTILTAPTASAWPVVWGFWDRRPRRSLPAWRRFKCCAVARR